jgi:hypothetical protein
VSGTLPKSTADLLQGLGHAAVCAHAVGQGTRRFGLGLVREKLAETSGSTIDMNLLAMNLETLLEFFGLDCHGPSHC